MAKKRMKKKVNKEKRSKKKVTKKAAKKSAKKKSRAVKKAKTPKKAATAAPEITGQLHQHDNGHNKPVDDLISVISDNVPELGLKEEITEEAEDFDVGNDTENLD